MNIILRTPDLFFLKTPVGVLTGLCNLKSPAAEVGVGHLEFSPGAAFGDRP